MNSSNYFKLFWNGNIKLWKSFWLVGELIYGTALIIIIQLDKFFFKSQYSFNISPTNEKLFVLVIFDLNSLAN